MNRKSSENYPIITKQCWKVWSLQGVYQMNELRAIHRIWCGERTPENKFEGKSYSKLQKIHCTLSTNTLGTNKAAGTEWWFRSWLTSLTVRGTIDLSQSSNDAWFYRRALVASFARLVACPSVQRSALAPCDFSMSPFWNRQDFQWNCAK